MNILIGSQAIYCRNNFWGTALYFPELARKEIRLLWEFPNRVKIQRVTLAPCDISCNMSTTVTH